MRVEFKEESGAPMLQLLAETKLEEGFLGDLAEEIGFNGTKLSALHIPPNGLAIARPKKRD